MNEAFALETPDIRLRTIGESDLERLRVWKNANKAAFFFKGEITPEMQRDWYAKFLKRQDDYMFTVEARNTPCGSMGFRIEDKEADVYNIMASPDGRIPGAMTAAMRVLCSFIAAAYRPLYTGCKVVRGNAALDYYKRCGYEVFEEKPDYYHLRISKAFTPVPYAKRSLT